MKYATLSFALAILMASVPAEAKVDNYCIHSVRDLGIPLAAAKRVCNPKMAKPNEWGWTCEGSGPPHKVKGGVRFKRDVLCE
jgi:hypothetical protein